jgi:hypothetical protein
MLYGCVISFELQYLKIVKLPSLMWLFVFSDHKTRARVITDYIQ